jgi:tRNA threonylcarbamoyladenosine biosynthesis protein TsaB
MQMILLVIDTSGKQGSVALARVADPSSNQTSSQLEVIEVAPLTGGTFSAQLVPQIAALLAAHRLTKTDIDAFVVVSGPGSFTGLRVGLAAVKALAEILQKPVIAISLLEILALASGKAGRVVAALDAGRGEVFAAEYEISSESVQMSSAQILSVHVLQERTLPRNEFLASVGNASVATSDPGLTELVGAAGLSTISVEPVTIASIAALGLRKLSAGAVVAPAQLDANYMRRFDAEIYAKIGS